MVNSASFLLLARTIQRGGHGDGRYASDRAFRALFGVSSLVVNDIWHAAKPNFPAGTKPKHLLWACLLLKVYGTEDALSSLVGTTRKTFRKWSWAVINVVSDLFSVLVSCVVIILSSVFIARD